MLGLSEIIRQNEVAAAKAARVRKQPLVLTPQEILRFPDIPVQFPYIGTYTPHGWKQVDEHFVDSSGFGREGEPALTLRQFKTKLVAGHGYAIVSASEFQVYVGEFVPVAPEDEEVD